MKETLIGPALVSLTSLCIAQVSNTALKPPPADRISIFQVPLRCPAAPQIGRGRAAALKEFQSDGWYRGAEVDRLSEEEAGIIATRLVSRLEAKSPLAKDKAKELQEALREALGKQLIAGNRDENYERKFHRIAGEFLDERQTAILKEAIESGLRPRPDEK